MLLLLSLWELFVFFIYSGTRTKSFLISGENLFIYVLMFCLVLPH